MYKGEEMSKLDKLKELLKSYQKVAIAYSGGCDSNFLSQVALQTLSKENVLAVLCVGKMMSKEDIDSARMMAGKGQFIEVPLDVFTLEQFTNNRKDRCYHCKKQVMAKVIEAAQAERVAKQQLGADAVVKGWKIEAHEGKILYYMTMHQDGKKTVVTVDAETGAYVGQTKSSKLPPEPDQGFDGRRTNIIWDNTIDMGR